MKSLICKLPAWLGGGHVERRLNKKEINLLEPAEKDEGRRMRICKRCGAERFTRVRKSSSLLAQAVIDHAPALQRLADSDKS